MVTLNAYQTKAVALAVFSPEDWDTYLPLQLASEAGEVAGKFAKAIRKGQPVFEMYPADELIKELGDVLWYVAVLADEMGYDLADVARMNIEKLESRTVRGTIHGEGDNR